MDPRVVEWLEQLKLGSYVEIFESYDVNTIDNVLDLDQERLMEIGITLHGHINRILKRKDQLLEMVASTEETQHQVNSEEQHSEHISMGEEVENISKDATMVDVQDQEMKLEQGHVSNGLDDYDDDDDDDGVFDVDGGDETEAEAEAEYYEDKTNESKATIDGDLVVENELSSRDEEEDEPSRKVAKTMDQTSATLMTYTDNCSDEGEDDDDDDDAFI
eukprot:m.112097 g.112097  ORF g.112097 m.112097 type:complete len:218 (+) comp9246_c4_seq1:119-772(+)